MFDAPVFYEVTCTVIEDLREDYEEYMCGKHIPDVLATDKFISAVLSVSSPGRYRVQYMAKDRASLDHYLAEFTKALRDDFMDRFPAGIDVKRAEWTVLCRFEGEKA